MNTLTTAGFQTLDAPNSGSTMAGSTNSCRAFAFCGKGLHYDWRAIVAAAEAADLDAELAHLGVPAAHS